MMWGAFAGTKRCELVTMEGKQNQDKYINTLESCLLPFVEQDLGPSYVFMEDGAAVHRAQRVYQLFDEEEILVMDWPAKSPDLNPIENLWGILARQVYANQRQFSNVNDLVSCVLEAWDAIPEQTLQNLVSSMQNCCFQCAMAKGGPTKY